MLYTLCNSYLRKIAILAIFLMISAVFSQEGIKFQVPLDENGELALEALPQKSDTVQKLGTVANRPLNLTSLSVKDTASFETYSYRIALLQDSISAMNKSIDIQKKRTMSFMPALESKSEFEKQQEYDVRKAKWDKELSDRTLRDTKSLTMRLDELEKAKKRIEGYQAAMYGSINIRSIPKEALIYVDKENIGVTPTNYNYLIPGMVTVAVNKDGYTRWDTTFQAAPGAKFTFNVELYEKSIFSEPDEIDFRKLLRQDATVEVYRQRIEVVSARKLQVGDELRKIQMDFANAYPPLKPQQVGESPADFNKRREVWQQEGMRQVAELQQKHDIYVQRLDRSVAVLNDYIAGIQSTIAMSEQVLGAKVELGAYNADKEQFEFVAQDSVNNRFPFVFRGWVGVPRDTARVMDRAVPGFAVNLQFINFPFIADSLNVNLAMSKLLLSKNGTNFKVDGSFDEIGRYKLQDGYAEWKLRADSLLSGALKRQGLDYVYAMRNEATQSAKKDDSGFGWRTWVRVVAFGGAIGTGVGAVLKHSNVNQRLDDIDKAKKVTPQQGDIEGEAAWKDYYNANKKSVERNELHRNLFSLAAIGCVAIGGVTFFF